MREWVGGEGGRGGDTEKRKLLSGKIWFSGVVRRRGEGGYKGKVGGGSWS